MMRACAVKLVLFMSLLLGCYSAAVVSYTGYSNNSVKEAETEAMAGIDKQIRSKVEAVMESSTKESIENKTDVKISQEFKSKSKLSTDIILKYVTIKKAPATKGYKYAATASVSLEDLMASAKTNMDEIQKVVTENEENSLKELSMNRFNDAIQSLEKSQDAARAYPKYLEECSVYTPLSQSLLLKSRYEQIKKEIAKALQNVRMTTASKEYEVMEDHLAFDVYLKKAGLPVPNMPIHVEYQGRKIAIAYTDEQGIAKIEISSDKLNVNPNELKVYVEIPYEYASLGQIQPLEIEYKKKDDSPVCVLNVVCNDDQSLCNSVTKKLKEQVGEYEQSSEIESLTITFAKSFVRENNGVKTYSTSVILNGSSVSCTVTSNGTGRTERDAVKTGISKINLHKCGDLRSACAINNNN